MKLHGKIQEELRKSYLEKGYSVFVEATIHIGEGRFYRVDILATKENESIIVEIGRINNQLKIEKLKELGYKIRIIPFHTYNKETESYKCICGHIWKPRKEKPKACPACKAYLYYESEVN